MTQDIASSLTPFERKVVKELKRIEIKGKHGRKVPILLTEIMVESIDFMLSIREKVVADDHDDFLFARPGNCVYPYRGHIVLGQTT